jgi:hypothetical protein
MLCALPHAYPWLGIGRPQWAAPPARAATPPEDGCSNAMMRDDFDGRRKRNLDGTKVLVVLREVGSESCSRVKQSTATEAAQL